MGRGPNPSSSTKPVSVPYLSATILRCPSASHRSCAVWRSWALLSAASFCPHVPPQMLSCSPATGHSPAQGGMGPQSTHATWGLEPGYIELLGNMGGTMEGMEPPDCPKCPLCASSAEYVGRLRATEKMKTRELHCEGASFDSIYICPSTFACAKLATGATCCLVEAVLAGKVRLLCGGALAPRGGPGGWRDVAWRKLGRT